MDRRAVFFPGQPPSYWRGGRTANPTAPDAAESLHIVIGGYVMCWAGGIRIGWQ